MDATWPARTSQTGCRALEKQGDEKAWRRYGRCTSSISMISIVILYFWREGPVVMRKALKIEDRGGWSPGQKNSSGLLPANLRGPHSSSSQQVHGTSVKFECADDINEVTEDCEALGHRRTCIFHCDIEACLKRDRLISTRDLLLPHASVQLLVTD